MKLKRTHGKGRKWKKGQSCVSNPENSKHRELAKGRFFQKIEGESGLTKEALAAHNNALSSVAKEMEDLSIDPDDLRSAGKSFNTFATTFTQCTIPAFERFFRNFNATSETHTRMLAIHAAAQEYMTEANMPETSTSYFCSLMVSLEGLKESEDDVEAVLSLMARVIRRVHIEVLQSKFGDFAKALDAIITQYQSSLKNALLTNAIGCMSVLLRAQDLEQWKISYTQNLLHKLVLFTMNEKPKIRKSAQYNVAAILKGSTFIVKSEEKISHPGSLPVGEFCVSQLRAASEMGNTKTTLHILVFLRQVIMTFPKKTMKSACECVLSLMQLGSSLINISSMEAIYSLLVSEPPSTVFSADTNAALIAALTNRLDSKTVRGVSVIPGMNDSQLACAWITVLTVAHINLFKLDQDQGLKFMPSWFRDLVPYWQSEHDEVQSKVSESFQAILEECIGNCSKEVIIANRDKMETIFQAVSSGLSYQYQGSWDCVFNSLDSCFKVLGAHFPEMLKPCLRSLSELMDNPKVPHRRYLEQSIGSFVTSVGPKAVMEVIPLQVTGNIAEDEKYLWILPILKRYIKNTQLAFFEDFFVHLAGKCFIIINSLKEKGEGDSILAKTYHTVENQIWNLLPGFCDKATDVDEVLGNEKFARIICDHIRLRDDTRITMMTALRTLVNDNVENPGKLSFYAKNYLPALFNIYLTKPQSFKGKSSPNELSESIISNGHRLAAYATIRTYLQIVPQPKYQEFLGMVMKKYNDETDEFKRQAFLDLARTFLPYIDSALVLRLFSKVKPILDAKTDRHVQKAAYRLLEETLSIRNEACQSFVNENIDELSSLLLKSISAAAPSSRAPRLRCVRQIVLQLDKNISEEKLNEFLQQVVGESVMCCGKSLSTSVRKAAFLLISEVGGTIQKHTGCTGEETVRRCIKMLLAGLAGSPMLASNTILAITSLAYQYKDIVSSDMLDLLMENMCTQLLCHSREVVGSSLSFIKSALVVFPIPVMTNYVDMVVKAMCGMVVDCQKKFRNKTRDIFDRLMRKFGADRTMALVPSDDDILQKRLRNLRKSAARKKREREAKKDGDDSDDDFETKAHPTSLDEILAAIDSEPEDDDDEDNDSMLKRKGKKAKGKLTKKKEKGTWIKEDEDEIVDLLDASAGKAMVSKRPILKASNTKRLENGKEDSGFKVDSKTGKLIITEENDTKESTSKMDFMEDIDEYLGLKEGAQSGKIKNRKRTLSGGSEDEDIFTPPMKFSKDGPDQEKAKRKPVKKHYDYGAEFRSKKAGGDMTKKDKLSPYAYVQFSKERLNKRKKAKFEGQFTSLVRGARKGVAKGMKLKGKKKMSGRK
ncbi:RRP12-like protein [Macrobrachium rosenbergii]|uniref:RRP12-like protein n=1 Tax=Macrobrachium rosenbergii TaxID=79674 RepID=UPI0034D40B42